MIRTFFACCVLGLLAVSSGCTMCAHPFDYCGPTFMPGGPVRCDPDARRGSILSPSLYAQPCSSCVPCGTETPCPGTQ